MSSQVFVTEGHDLYELPSCIQSNAWHLHYCKCSCMPVIMLGTFNKQLSSLHETWYISSGCEKCPESRDISFSMRTWPKQTLFEEQSNLIKGCTGCVQILELLDGILFVWCSCSFIHCLYPFITQLTFSQFLCRLTGWTNGGLQFTRNRERNTATQNYYKSW